MGDLKQALADALDGARQRSLGLLDPLSDEDQLAQHSPLMSPLVWDLAHVGHYEELWLLRAVARSRPIDPAHDDIYDAFKHVRRERAKLAILGPGEAATTSPWCGAGCSTLSSGWSSIRPSRCSTTA